MSPRVCSPPAGGRMMLVSALLPDVNRDPKAASAEAAAPDSAPSGARARRPDCGERP